MEGNAGRVSTSQEKATLIMKRRTIYLTRHAKRRMKWRGISLEEVKEIVASPDRVEKLATGRKNAFKSIGIKLIRVSYIDEKDRIKIISVVDKNR